MVPEQEGEVEEAAAAASGGAWFSWKVSTGAPVPGAAGVPDSGADSDFCGHLTAVLGVGVAPLVDIHHEGDHQGGVRFREGICQSIDYLTPFEL